MLDPWCVKFWLIEVIFEVLNPIWTFVKLLIELLFDKYLIFNFYEVDNIDLISWTNSVLFFLYTCFFSLDYQVALLQLVGETVWIYIFQSFCFCIFKVDKYIKSGMVIGLGSGHASGMAIQYLGQQLRVGSLEDIVGIATWVLFLISSSNNIRLVCEYYGASWSWFLSS